MALQKQPFTIDFGLGGLDQKTDEKRVIPTRLLQADNWRVTKPGKFDRRPAMVNLLQSHTAAKLFDNRGALMQVSMQDPPAFIGAASSDHTAAAAQVYAFPAGPTNAAMRPDCWDIAYGASYYAVGYVLNSLAYVDVYTHGGGLLGTWSINSSETCNKLRIVADPADGVAGNFIASFVTSAGSTKYYYFSAGSSPAAMTTLADSAVFNKEYDCIAVRANSNSYFYTLTARSTNVMLRRIAFPSSFTASPPVTSLTLATSITPNRVCLPSWNWSNSSAFPSEMSPLWHQGTQGIVISRVNPNTMATSAASITVSSSSTVAPEYMTAVHLPPGSNTSLLDLYVEMAPDANAHNRYVTQFQGDPSLGSAGYAATINYRGQGLASKAWCQPGGTQSYFWAHYDTSLQKTYFLRSGYRNNKLTGNVAGVHGRVFYSRGIGVTSRTTTCLPHVCSLTTDNLTQYWDNYITALPALNKSLGTFNGSAADFFSLQRVTTRLYGGRNPNGDSNGWYSTQNRDEFLITGGYLQQCLYGADPMPNGWLLAPESTTVTASGSGSMAAGTYGVCGLWEYVDASGRVHRSAPSVPVTVSVGASGTINSTWQTLRLQAGYNNPTFDPTIAQPKLILYRTLQNGGTYYRASSSNMAWLPTTDTMNVSVSAADASINTNEILYTTGNVEANYQPSCPIAIATNGRRVLCVEGDKPNFVLESKALVSGEGIAFMQDVGREINGSGASIVALASMDNRWIAWKTSGTFVATGDGADDTGSQDTLTEFEPISTTIGCTYPQSVVQTPLGIVFKSARGFYLLGRDLQLTYIGAAIETYDLYGIVSASYDAGTQTAHFLQTDTRTLVLTLLETESGVQWIWTRDDPIGLWENYRSMVIIGGAKYGAIRNVQSANSNYSLQVESGYSGVTRTLVSAWVPMASIQGFGRLYEALLLGTHSGDASDTTQITVSIAYDYESAYSETKTFGAYAYQTNGVLQASLRPARQKCQAVRFKITESSPHASTSWSLNQLQLIVGIKGPGNQLSAARSK